MHHVKYLFLIGLIGAWGVLAWSLPGSPIPDFFALVIAPRPNIAPRMEPIVNVDPDIQAKFARIKVGMTLDEVDGALGKSEGNISSQAERECYLWKSKKGWIFVTVENGKVTRTHLNPEPPVED